LILAGVLYPPAGKILAMERNVKSDINLPVVRAIILAAGNSSRTVSPKMLLKFGEKTLIEKVIEHTLNSDVKSITVVLGAHRFQIQNVIEKLPVNIVYNDKYEEGMLSSVICGIRSLPEDTEAAIIIPGDYPFISGYLINIMILSLRETQKGIIIPVYKGRRGHPLLTGKKYFSEIELLDSNKGLRFLIDRFRDDVFELETDDEGIFIDIDTIEDYNDAVNKI